MQKIRSWAARVILFAVDAATDISELAYRAEGRLASLAHRVRGDIA